MSTLKNNSFYLTQGILNVFKLYSHNGTIQVVLSNNQECIILDIKIKTKKEYVIVGISKIEEQKTNEVTILALNTDEKCSFKLCHDVLCHRNDNNA